MYSQEFNQCNDRLLVVEGGFTVNPKDDGNWTGGREGVGLLKGTKYGISAASYPDLDIKNLTKAEATRIYFTDYWLKSNCDVLPAGLSLVVYSSAINQGVGKAIRVLQEALGVNVDGVFGPITFKAAKDKNTLMILERFTSIRVYSYTTFRRWPEMGEGWVRRLNKIYMAAIIFHLKGAMQTDLEQVP